MRERRTLVIGAAVLIALVLIVTVCGYWRARRLKQVPAWVNPGMNADGLYAGLGTLTPAESQAANGCVPMAGCCAPHTARREAMRTYPASLTHSPDSFVGLRFGIGL
jgi:hypothetical protein